MILPKIQKLKSTTLKKLQQRVGKILVTNKEETKKAKNFKIYAGVLKNMLSITVRSWVPAHQYCKSSIGNIHSPKSLRVHWSAF